MPYIHTFVEINHFLAVTLDASQSFSPGPHKHQCLVTADHILWAGNCHTIYPNTPAFGAYFPRPR